MKPRPACQRRAQPGLLGGSFGGENAYDVTDFAIHENVDGYSVCVAHDEYFDVLAIDGFSRLFCADYGGCRFDADFIERVVAQP
jgi:hypothetical protein